MIAIYARQSVEKKDSLSIESQIQLCKNEIAGEAYRIYQDQGYSGKNMERPGFQALLRDVRTGQIAKVIIYKLDRMSRSLLDFANLIALFKQYDVDFQSTQEKFDTSTPIGNAMLSITMVFAQLERETIQQRIRDNYYTRGEKGFFLGGPAPYGLCKVETRVEGKKTHTYLLDETREPVLRRVFHSYAQGDRSLGQIAKELNMEGIAGPQGNTKWDSGKLSRILRNPIYVKSNEDVFAYYKEKGCSIAWKPFADRSGNGCYLYGKQPEGTRKYGSIAGRIISPALHPGLIEPDIFLVCQRLLDRNSPLKNSGKGKNSWLSGIICCGRCGFAMTVDTGTTAGEKRKYFHCSGRKNTGNCPGHSVVYRVPEVERAVEQQLLRMVRLHGNWTCTQPAQCTKEERALQAELDQIEEQINRLLAQLSEGSAVVDGYIGREIENLDQKKLGLNARILQEKEQNKQEAFRLNVLAEQWPVFSLEQKKVIASLFIEKIALTDAVITIRWQPPFQLQT